MNTTLSTDLALAHITELRRQACRSRFVGTARAARAARRSRRRAVRGHRHFDRFLPVSAGLFHV